MANGYSKKVTIQRFGLQAGTTNTLSVVWTCYREHLENYKVKWQYATGDYKDNGDLVWYQGSESETDYGAATYSIPDNATVVQVYILPVSKTHTVNGSEVSYWTDVEWASRTYYTGKDTSIDSSLSTPSAPTVEIDGTKLTASVTGITDATYVEFLIAINDQLDFKRSTATVYTQVASCTLTVALGAKYKARCRLKKISGNSYVYSEWSEYSSNVATVPPAPSGFESITSVSGTELSLTWSAVSTAETYEIEYTDDKSDFDQSDQTSSKSGIKKTSYKINGLTEDTRYYFRLRATNSQGSSEWSAVTSYKTQGELSEPSTPSAPTVEIDGKKLTASITGIEDADYIVFQYARDDTTIIGYTPRIEVRTDTASYTRDVTLGHEYKVRCRAVKKSGLYSDWSDWSSNVGTVPSTPSKITKCYAKSSTSVYLSWTAVSTAETYEIQYADDKDYLTTNSDQPSSKKTEDAATSYILSGLESGKEYFFRVRAVNSQGNSGWTGIKSVVIGEKPAAPTTWQSVSTCVLGDSIILYWTHNSEDGSAQTKAHIQITTLKDDGSLFNLLYKTIDTSSEDDDEKTQCYTYTPNSSVAEKTLKWRVRTAGATGAYGDWSVQRSFKVYDQPELSLELMNSDEVEITQLTSLPLIISASVSSELSQKPISYNLSITPTSSYTTVDNVGNEKRVLEGTSIYSKNFDISTDLQVTLSGGDISFENGVSYTVTCTVYMDSGLTATSSQSLQINWGSYEHVPDARIGYNGTTFTTSIAPYCERYESSWYAVEYDSVIEEYHVDLSAAVEKPESKYLYKTNAYTTDGDEVYFKISSATDSYYCIRYSDVSTLEENVTLSVYRREFDGTFTELATGIQNTGSSYITDPHPALDYARYRIVAIDSETGAVSYTDLSGYPINETSVIIQWDEEWTSFDTTNSDPMSEPEWSGSLLKLPYNIDVSDSFSPDTSLVKYTGRKNPVSYYGTQIGSTSTWNVEIEKSDKDTLYALRRLAIWMGDVYVREPSGSGYWANVTVSFSQKHCELTIPVTLNITRVSGGV